MSMKFGQIQQVVSMVTDRVMMEKTVSPLFLGCFSSVPFYNCSNYDMHESSDEFEFQLDLTTDCGVSCP